MSKKFLSQLKKNRKPLVIGVLVLTVLFVSILVVKKSVFKGGEKSRYEVAVLVRDQSGTQDRSQNLRAGEVLLYKQGENLSWSKTELVSYLILKMELTAEQAAKLTAPVDKELSKDDKKTELDRFREGREDISAEELEMFEAELEQRRETVQMRKYAIDMDKFECFEPNDLLAGQPYDDEVFDWGIVEKSN